MRSNWIIPGLAAAVSLVMALFGLTAQASTYDWTFQLGDGTPATFEMSGEAAYCISPPTSKFTLTVGAKTTYQSTLCQDGQDPDRFYGTFTYGSAQDLAAFFVYIDASYRSLMKQFQQSGPGGDLGNSVDGQCPANGNAFLMLSGDTIGDKPVTGYCMVPRAQ